MITDAEDDQRSPVRHRRSGPSAGQPPLDVARADRQAIESPAGTATAAAATPAGTISTRGRDAVGHPAGERDLDAGELLQLRDGNQVRGGACRGGDAADQRAKRRRDHHGPPDVALPRAQTGVTRGSPTPSGSSIAATAMSVIHHEMNEPTTSSPSSTRSTRVPTPEQQQVDEPGAEARAGERRRQHQHADEEHDDRIAEAGGDDVR